MPLAERELKQLAAATGSSEKAVFRLLGSVRVRLQTPSADASTPELSCRELDLGLRLHHGEVLNALYMSVGKDAALRLLEEALRGYFSASPLVCGWVGRGDFDGEQIPSHISRGTLQHACRTAGRLRAKVLRG